MGETSSGDSRVEVLQCFSKSDVDLMQVKCHTVSSKRELTSQTRE